MANTIVSARVKLGQYSNKVLSVVKAKFALKDKSEALNKFIEIYGEELVEKQASDEYVKKTIEIANNHFEKYKNKKMSLQELDNLCEI